MVLDACQGVIPIKWADVRETDAGLKRLEASWVGRVRDVAHAWRLQDGPTNRDRRMRRGPWMSEAPDREPRTNPIEQLTQWHEANPPPTVHQAALRANRAGSLASLQRLTDQYGLTKQARDAIPASALEAALAYVELRDKAKALAAASWRWHRLRPTPGTQAPSRGLCPRLERPPSRRCRTKRRHSPPCVRISNGCRPPQGWALAARVRNSGSNSGRASHRLPGRAGTGPRPPAADRRRPHAQVERLVLALNVWRDLSSSIGSS